MVLDPTADPDRNEMKPSIQLASGRFFYYLDPWRPDIPIEDFAWAISNLCRYFGHCREFYSVAQHSVLTSYVEPWTEPRPKLMHDLIEGVAGDMVSPFKMLLGEYRAHEKRLEHEILPRFGVNPEMSAEVKRADIIMLATERRDLMVDRPISYLDSVLISMGLRTAPPRWEPDDAG